LKREVHVIGFEGNNVKVKMCKLEKIQTLLVNCEQTYQFIDCKMEKVLTERIMVLECVLSMKAITNNGREFNEICSYFIYHLNVVSLDTIFLGIE